VNGLGGSGHILALPTANSFMDTYKATNTLNGRFYIGSTTNFDKRKKAHLNSKQNYPFQNALRKNPDAFEWEVWSDDSEEPILEQALLDMWFGKECCYNLNPSAQHPPSARGRIASPEWREKMRELNLGEKNPNYGKTPSPETRQRMRDRMSGENNPFYGKRHTEESKQKNREAHAGENHPRFGKRGELSPLFGKKHTEETKQKMSEDRSGEKHWNYGKETPEEVKHKLRESKLGRSWWVSPSGETKLAREKPGPEWKQGRKWED
jgi:group I intron endonuclease